MRRPLVAGNWKMYQTPGQARRLALELSNGLLGSRLAVDVVVCPPFVSLAAVREIIGKTDIQLGAQNVFWEAEGAWTGEVSAAMLEDAGCQHVILGHSERRQHFGETNQTVRKRLDAVLKSELTAIVCVGETLEQRQRGATATIVRTQLQESLATLSAEDWARIVVAYEPVWAIGTGQTASPDQAQEVHLLIRQEIQRLATREIGSEIRILYGGSVKPDNAAILFNQPDLDGGLIGGASLQAASFLSIVEAAAP